LFLARDEGQKLLKMKSKLSALTTQIETLRNQSSAIPPLTTTTRDQLRQDIENILAAECTMCGSLMIQQMDRNFAVVNESW